ncbi:down syndrome cell adhesion molecule-like protein Dscam2 [Caerostris extrusa]|uniref:Down syndrome cell adhesion molecule-like protein Dscam2 n=1 Tax=Caerostris extrusa TaxID=172846 RepID=A0AAV4WQZ8_CAEEX|nr:down syndrome cell adhesion molecule-like protein Dscam2 [Caerostris extrusa]
MLVLTIAISQLWQRAEPPSHAPVRATPAPQITWIKKDGTPVSDVTGLRHVRPDGTLVFQPFRAEEYRQDVHSAVYRCVARNVCGGHSQQGRQCKSW